MSSGQCKTRISENAIYFTSHHWIVYHSSVDWRNYVLFLWMSSWAMKATPQTIAVPFVFSRRNYCLGHEMIAFLIQLKHVMVFTTYKNRLPPFPVVSVKADQEVTPGNVAYCDRQSGCPRIDHGKSFYCILRGRPLPAVVIYRLIIKSY